ncbi:type II secretion system protein [Deinococcus psychrotolerans]|uniref:Type II secretion system protein n=1 Tax=Deinococcus psychrotolerans TaxID=2489213 RepID=A0A3G8YE77_9DEIO|nr:type II secretion system protein [Deinococcus psychrotolerans]AZI43275.1 type II secretion system protein [Deinococcus psychrotolerans]
MNNKNRTQGFTLIELLIVIAIIGILAAVLIPNLLGAQKRAYDTGAQSCAKSLQTAMAIQQIDNQTYPVVDLAMSGANSTCSNGKISLPSKNTAAQNDYSFTIRDSRGSKEYTVTPSSLSATTSF